MSKAKGCHLCLAAPKRIFNLCFECQARVCRTCSVVVRYCRGLGRVCVKCAKAQAKLRNRDAGRYHKALSESGKLADAGRP